MSADPSSSLMQGHSHRGTKKEVTWSHRHFIFFAVVVVVDANCAAAEKKRKSGSLKPSMFLKRLFLHVGAVF